MTEHTAAHPAAPVPVVSSALRAFAYAPDGPTTDERGDLIDLAEDFHEASKIRAGLAAASLGPAGRYLTTVAESAFALGRRSLAHAGPGVALPSPASLPVDLCRLVRSRRSGLPDAPRPLTLDQVGTLLALSAARSPDHPGLRVTPSGGALYPVDVVVIAHLVRGLAPGAHVYDAAGHALVPRGQVPPELFHRAAGDTIAPPQPALTLALVATFARTRAKYGLRGYRFALLEAGHLAQALLTAATALGLAALPWGGYVDDAVDTALDLDGVDRSCVYLVAVSGPPAPDPAPRASDGAP